MTSSNTRLPGPNWLSLLISLITATTMWYLVSVRDRIEAQVEINIDYIGIPQNLIVTNGLVSKITVRLRGPETLLRSILRQNINEAIDLSYIKKGVTIVPLPTSDISPALRAFEVVDIQPPRITVTADNLIERTVPIKAVIDSPLRNEAVTVENVTVSPATVVLRGPEDRISHMTNVPVVIHVDPKAADTAVQQTMPLDTPSLVTSVPSSVRVGYKVTSRRTVIARVCNLKVPEVAAHHYRVVPEKLNVLVEVPEALAHASSYLNQLEAVVVPTTLKHGESRKIKVQFKLPDGMTLIEPINKEVTITRLEK